MTKNKKIILIVFTIGLLAAAGLLLYPDDVAKIRIPEASVAKALTVDEIDIQVLGSFPVQVRVIARGNLPDGCTTIKDVTKERQDLKFIVEITGQRPADIACTQALVPFEEVIDLDVYGLKAGTYTVEVNGVRDTFELSTDNVPQDGGK